jgi:hypothetical protein
MGGGYSPSQQRDDNQKRHTQNASQIKHQRAAATDARWKGPQRALDSGRLLQCLHAFAGQIKSHMLFTAIE